MAITVFDPIENWGFSLPYNPSFIVVDRDGPIEVATLPSVYVASTSDYTTFVSPASLADNELTSPYVSIGDNFQPGAGGGGPVRPNSGILY